MDAIDELQRAVDRLAWRAMESAPKDGSKIMIHMKLNDDLGPIIVEWDDKERIWQVCWDGTDICKEWGDEPICWMPVPDKPYRDNG
jgi:hypothetical protein